MIADYPAPDHLASSDGPSEFALAFDRQRDNRLLIVPPLFDELNRMRRLIAGTMRRLDGAGVDSFLIDLPGTNESLAELSEQNAERWQRAATRAGEHFGATHVLGIRGGALVVPAHLPGWLYAPATGRSILRRMARARTVAARETGRKETVDEILETGARDGIEMAGYHLGPAMIADLATRIAPDRPKLATIAQDTVGGAGLWLRAEPGDAPQQADALAAAISMSLTA